MHVVPSPESMVTSAAYLLFYRRRSSRPLGGGRFAEILDKYSRESSRSEDEQTDASQGEGEGKAKGGMEMAANDGPLSSIKKSTLHEEPIRRSIEEEGDDFTAGSYMWSGSKSLDMKQSWSFDGLDGSGAEGSVGGECASDEGKPESSGEDQGRGSTGDDGEADSATTAEEGAGWEGQKVISVPAQAGTDADSDEVTEIHLEGDRAVRNW